MTLPTWLEPLPDAERMRSLDRWAIGERGVPSLELMERAGTALADLAAREAPAGRIAIVCGAGHNGGDGFVAGRHLREAGRDVVVLSSWEAEDMLRGDPAAALAALPGPAPVPFAPDALDGVALIVDALMGSGFTGTPREPAASVISAMDAAAAPVVAADVPSGVDASSGEVEGPAVHAVATATFHQAMPGLWIHPGKGHVGRLEVIDLDMPPDEPGEAAAGLMRPGVLDAIPRRGALSTKFSSGNVVILGGSRGLTGALSLAALAAVRCGAGYVTAGVPASLQSVFALRLLEAMSVGLPDADGILSAAALESALAAVARADAVVLGPGISKDPEAQGLVRELIAAIPVPLVIDADGLNAVAGELEATVGRRTAPTVLTPHAGELGRLLGLPSAEIDRRRLRHARDAAAIAGAVVVLKGDDTLVAEPGGRVAISPGGAPGLATAGTGDVLAGLLGALLARGMDPVTATSAAVFAHLRAGRLAAEPHGPDTVIASDVIAALPAALARAG